MPDEPADSLPSANDTASARHLSQEELEHVATEIRSALQPYIGAPLSQETIDQMQAGVDHLAEHQQRMEEERHRLRIETMSQQISAEVDRELISRLLPNPVGQLNENGELTITSPPALGSFCTVCGYERCAHLGNLAERIDDVLETDFHTSLSNVIYPAIDRLVGSSVTRQTPARGLTNASVTIYYQSYDQLQRHLNLNNDAFPHRGMVWYRDEYWYVDQVTTANARMGGGYEVTLELTMAASIAQNVIQGQASELSLVENPNGQFDWVLHANEPVNHIQLDFTIGGESTTIANPNAIVSVNINVEDEEPITVLKKVRCTVCNKRGCSADQHCVAKVQDALNADALDEPLTELQSNLLNSVGQVSLPLANSAPPILGTVVEQHGDTSYIRIGNGNSGSTATIAHDLAIDGSPVTVGTRVTFDANGHIVPISNNPPYSPPNQ